MKMSWRTWYSVLTKMDQWMTLLPMKTRVQNQCLVNQSNKKKPSSTNSPKQKSHPKEPKTKSSASDAASKGKVDSAKSAPSKQHRKKQKAPENLSNKDVPSHAKKFKKRKTSNSWSMGNYWRQFSHFSFPTIANPVEIARKNFVR